MLADPLAYVKSGRSRAVFPTPIVDWFMLCQDIPVATSETAPHVNAIYSLFMSQVFGRMCLPGRTEVKIGTHTVNTRIEVAAMLQGAAGGGKSSIQSIAQRLLGNDSGFAGSVVGTLENSVETSFPLASILDAMVLHISEIGPNFNLDSRMLLKMISQEDIMIAIKNKVGIQGPFTKPILMCSNEGIKTGDNNKSGELDRRLLIFAFHRTLQKIVDFVNENDNAMEKEFCRHVFQTYAMAPVYGPDPSRWPQQPRLATASVDAARIERPSLFAKGMIELQAFLLVRSQGVVANVNGDMLLMDELTNRYFFEQQEKYSRVYILWSKFVRTSQYIEWELDSQEGKMTRFENGKLRPDFYADAFNRETRSVWSVTYNTLYNAIAHWARNRPRDTPELDNSDRVKSVFERLGIYEHEGRYYGLRLRTGMQAAPAPAAFVQPAFQEAAIPGV